jgi:hypothetical protein
MYLMRKLGIVCVVLFFAAIGAQADTRIVDPTVMNYDSFPNVKAGQKFFVDAVKDTVLGRADSGLVGYVHTRYGHPTAIICRPLPAAAVSQSLQTLLEKKGASVSDRNAATYLIRVSLLQFALKETPHFFYQTIAVTIQLKVDLIDPRTSQIARSFTIDSQRSRGVFNSGRNSVKVIRGALQDALTNVMQSLNGF